MNGSFRNREMQDGSLRDQLEKIDMPTGLIYYCSDKDDGSGFSLNKHAIVVKEHTVLTLCEELDIDPSYYVKEMRSDKLNKYFKNKS